MKSAESARVLVVFILDIGGSVVAGKRVVAGKAEVALGVTVVFEAELSQGRRIGWQFDDWNVVVRQAVVVSRGVAVVAGRGYRNAGQGVQRVW